MAGEWRGIDGNKHVFQRLTAVIASGGAMALIGAGASAGLYPLWPQLIRRLADETVAQGLALQADRDFWCNPKTNPQQGVQGIKNALGRGAYADALRRIFGRRTGPDGKSYTAVHAALMRLSFRGFITTNYDLGLVEARGAVRPRALGGYATWRDKDPVSRWLTEEIFREQPCPILFAHGVCERADTIILGADDYREAYATAPFSKLFDFLWGQCRLVFVGFGFSDPWLDFLADAAVTRTAARDVAGPRHFAIIGLKQDEAYTPERRRSFRDAYNADPLFYPVSIAPGGGCEDHSALLEVLHALAEEATGTSHDDRWTAPGVCDPATEAPRRGHGAEPSQVDPQPPSQAAGGIELSLSDPVVPMVTAAQEEKTAEALKRSPQFLRALQDKKLFNSFRPGREPPATEEDMARTFAACDARDAPNAILLVRRALAIMNKQHQEASRDRRSTEEAAAGLYCLAVARLVSDDERNAITMRLEGGDFVVHVPTSTNILCAIIAMAVAGGEIDLVPGKTEDLPKAKFVFDVKAPESSDQVEVDFVLALCAKVFENDSEFIQISQSRGSEKWLKMEQRKRLTSALKARFETYREVDNKTVGIVVEALEASQVSAFANACSALARDHKVPVMLPANGVSSRFLGMDVQDLEARIAEFWKQLVVLRLSKHSGGSVTLASES